MLKDLKLQYGFTEFHYSSLYSEKGKTSNSPCLRPLRVVREVLRVLADPQVLGYRLFRLGLEDLSLPKKDAFFVFHVRHAQSVKRFCMWQQSFLFLPVHLSLQQGLVVLEGQDVQEDL